METDESGESREASKEDMGSSTVPPAESKSELQTVEPEIESEPEPEWIQKLRRVMTVLSGECTVALRQDFLIRNNHTDLLLLKAMKVGGHTAVGSAHTRALPLPCMLVVTPTPQDVSRSSISHNGVVVANGFMHCGTTADTFLRENLEWLKKATNWAKFTATASLGVIHQVGGEDGVGGEDQYLWRELPLPPSLTGP